MSSEFGNILRVSAFGESHGRAVGVLIDGLPAGERIDFDELQRFLDRRRPGRDALSSARSESDKPTFLSGLLDGRTSGSPVCAIMQNADARPGDYDAILDTPRPAHADYTAFVKWRAMADMRGGGHFSGRLTAPLCVAGGIAKQILARRSMFVGAHLLSVGSLVDQGFPERPSAGLFYEIAAKPFPVIDDERGAAMCGLIETVAREGDSVGGVVECAAIGLPAGLGAPMFGGVESRLASALFGVPAVKAVEFGSGFRGAALRGSENNDPFAIGPDGRVTTLSNNSGGILGGITNGMPVVLCAAIKPTPSIARLQQSVSLSRMEPVEIQIKGRHDPCIAHRAVPVIEAVTACVLLDMLLEEG